MPPIGGRQNQKPVLAHSPVLFLVQFCLLQSLCTLGLQSSAWWAPCQCGWRDAGNQAEGPIMTKLWSHLEAGWKFQPTLLAFPLTAPPTLIHIHTQNPPGRSALCSPLLWALGLSYDWATMDRQPLKQPRGLPAGPRCLGQATLGQKPDKLGPWEHEDGISRAPIRPPRKQAS